MNFNTELLLIIVLIETDSVEIEMVFVGEYYTWKWVEKDLRFLLMLGTGLIKWKTDLMHV